MKKQSIVIIVIICIVLIGGSILAIKHGTFSSPQNQNASGIIQEQPKKTFPDKNPLFTFTLTSKKTPSSSSDVDQQSIIIYLINDDKKKPIFQRDYYADGFNGDELIYLFSTNSDSFKQRGTLGTIGCTESDCSLPWSNFYIWNTTANKFIVDNGAERDDFTQLLNKYNTIDKKGCSLFTQHPLPNQQGLSLSELYQHYPTNSSYCKTTQGLSTKNLIFFLQAEKVIKEILKGKNLSSNDIQDTSL